MTEEDVLSGSPIDGKITLKLEVGQEDVLSGSPRSPIDGKTTLELAVTEEDVLSAWKPSRW